MKKDRATMSDEQRERQLIAEQIERAAADVEAGPSSSSSPPAEEGLKREEGADKVVLSLSAKPAATAASISFGGFKANPLKAGANPLKRPNVLKTLATASVGDNSDKASTNEKKRSAPMSAAEKLILEEQERKRRRMDRDNFV